MIFGRLRIEDAEGAILAHKVRSEKHILKKGHKLSADDVIQLAAAKVESVMAARLESGDIPEDEAASLVAIAVHGPNTHLKPAFTGRRNLYSSVRGLALIDGERVNAINSVDESITLATISPFSIVKKHQLVATIKIIPLSATEETVRACQTLANKNGPLVSVSPLKKKSVGLISTSIPQTKDSILDKTVSTIRDRVESLGSELTYSHLCPHCETEIANAIHDLIRVGCSPILILGATSIIDKRDIVPLAIVNAGGSIKHFGMPVDPGNLTLLANVKDTPILALPGSARSRRHHGSDFLLPRLLAELPIQKKDIIALGAGGLLKEVPERPQPRDHQIKSLVKKHYKVAAIVLAAGESKRMGQSNKLLAQIDGSPLVARVADAAISSNAMPVVVVTGYQHENVEEVFITRDVILVHNKGYEKGLSSSLSLGINALPPVDAALICLGDMPNITRTHLNQLISHFSPSERRSICVPTYRGKRGNPVLWSAEYFDEICALKGDMGARRLMTAYPKEVHEVEIENSSIFIDVDTPEELQAIQNSDQNRY